MAIRIKVDTYLLLGLIPGHTRPTVLSVGICRFQIIDLDIQVLHDDLLPGRDGQTGGV